MIQKTPTLAVVMPVFNAMPYLNEAVESILSQTYSDFEFTIYDDCSTDGSYERLLEWEARDPRIKVARGTHRLGPCGSSNAAAALTDAEFVARMDADDISAPDRLKKQLMILTQHADAAVVGSIFEMVDAVGRCIRRPTASRILGPTPPMGHCTIMYRNSLFKAIGGYSRNSDYFEDLDLYLRIAKVGRILVCNEPLVRVRYAGQHARLKDDRVEVLSKIDRLYSDGLQRTTASDAISMNAYYAVAILHILSLERPRMFAEMIINGSFARPIRALVVITVVGIAEISPRFARFLNQTVWDLREILFAPRVGTQPVLEWSPPVNS